MRVGGRLIGMDYSSLAVLAAALAAAPGAAAQQAARPIAFQAGGDQNTAVPAAQTPQKLPVVAAAETGEADRQEMVVTGSRIVRDGTDAPVPTTVVSIEDIQARNPTNIADYVNQLPAIGQGQ